MRVILTVGKSQLEKTNKILLGKGRLPAAIYAISKNKFMWAILFSKDTVTQLTFTCSNSTIEALEKGVDFEQINVSW